MIDKRLYPQRNNCRIGTIRVLSPAKHIEVPKSYRLYPIQRCEHIGIQLIHKLRNRIGRQRPADVMFYLRQLLAITVCRTRCCIHKTLYFLIPCCYQHVQESADVRRVGCNRVINTAWHRPQCCFMKHHITTLHRLAASLQVADVTFDKSEVRLLHQRLNVMHKSGTQIIQAHHIVTVVHKPLT